MADPTSETITAGQWNLVATAVVSGNLQRQKSDPNVYLQAYRDTGGTAPTLESEGVPMFAGNPITEPISAKAPIDVYVWAKGKDGQLRVDV